MEKRFIFLLYNNKTIINGEMMENELAVTSASYIFPSKMVFEPITLGVL